jgi:hypothetical protein
MILELHKLMKDRRPRERTAGSNETPKCKLPGPSGGTDSESAFEFAEANGSGCSVLI